MKTRNNGKRVVVALISAALIFSAANASDPEKKPVANTGMSLSSEDYPDLRVVELGVHYMPTFYSMDFNTSEGDIIEGSVTMSHGFGIMLGINFNPHIGIQGEIDYYKATQKYSDQSVDNEVDIKYLNIPVLLSLNTSKMARLNLNAVVGPQFGINVGSDINSSGSNGTTRAVVETKKGDIGAAYGAGLEFVLNQNRTIRFDIGYRGFYGFVDVDADKTGEDTYNVMVSANRKTHAAYARITFLF
jgi:opacity protein-like surface antigen